MARKIKPQQARSAFKEKFVFTMGLKPVRLFCLHCGGYIAGDMKWRCGYCNTENTATRYYSFLNKCRNCKGQPKAVVCPNSKCGELNYLGKKQDGSHPASSIAVPIP